MKNQKMGVISLLLSSASAQSVGRWYAHYPMWSTQNIPAAKIAAFAARNTPGSYNGNYSDLGYSCTQCIMAGNVWCSRKWYYELPYAWSAYQVNQSDGTDPNSSEFGQCCYAQYENNTATGYATGATFNASACPAQKGSPLPGSAAAYWCSDANPNSVELAIATCR